MHCCKPDSFQDFLICQAESCYANSVGCRQCFEYSHVSQQQGIKTVHESIQFTESPLYHCVRRLSVIQQLLQKKIKKDFSAFKTNFDSLALIALCQSDFFKQIFTNDQNLINQFMYIRELLIGNPVVFPNPPSDYFCNKLKTVTQANIAPYKKSLQQHTKQWQFVNLQVSYIIGNQADRLETFVNYQQQSLNEYCEQLRENSKSLDIYQYIQRRRSQQKQSSEVKIDPIYFSRQFQDFLIEKYRENPSQKSIFDIAQFVNNFWKYFGHSIYANPNAKAYFEFQLQSYSMYKDYTKEVQVQQSLLGFKTWKTVNRPSSQIANLKSHYFYQTYILALIDLKIRKWVDEEKDYKIGALQFSKYLRQYTEYNKQNIVDLSAYQEYFLFRQSAQKFLLHLKQSSDIVYNKKLAIEYLNQVFKSCTKPALKKYKQYLEQKQVAEELKIAKEREIAEQLKYKCMQEQGEKFYDYIFSNFVSYATEKERPMNSQQYYIYKKAVLEQYDEEYIRLQDQRTKEAIAASQAQENNEQREGRMKQTSEEINEEEEHMLGISIDSENQDQMQLCLCCNGNPYNCDQEECKMMGCCVTCMLS